MMKGLFIKDLRLMKAQKHFFGVVLMMMVIFLTVYTDFSFVIAYITVMFGFLTVSTISFDEQDNGLGYLLALPVSRSDYVKEKYLFSIATAIPGLLIVSVLAFAVSRIRGIDFVVEEWVMTTAVSLLIVGVMLSVVIPVQLKFGADKSRVVMLILFGGGSLTIYAGVKICDTFGIDYMPMLNWLAGIRPTITLAGVALVCTVLMGVSYLISRSFIEAREF